MKRIVHVVGFAVRGGCETNCATFIRHAPGFRHHVLVLERPGPMTEVWRELGASVSHHYSLGRGWISFRQQMRRIWRFLPKDGAIFWAGIRVPLLLTGRHGLGCPVVLHGGNPFPGGVRINSLLVLADWLLGRPRPVRVMACSSAVAESFRTSRYYRRFPIEAVLNPIEAPADNPHRPRALAPADAVRIGMVARLDPIKDHATLLRAFAVLRRDWPRATLELAGEGVLRTDLERLAGQLGIADAVRFHGTVADVPGFLRQLDLFAYSTTAQEGMGNALVEAMAQGLPCVVSDLPVMREVVGEPPAAWLGDAGSEKAWSGRMADLLADIDERRRLAAAAHARAREAFAPGRVVAAYLAALGLAP